MRLMQLSDRLVRYPQSHTDTRDYRRTITLDGLDESDRDGSLLVPSLPVQERDLTRTAELSGRQKAHGGGKFVERRRAMLE